MDRERSALGQGRALLASAAMLAVVAGTAAGVSWLRAGAGTDSRPLPDPSTVETPPDELAAGWRYESFRDVQVQVPDSLEYRASPGSDWCVDDEKPHDVSSTPYVDLRGPFSSSLSILCPGEGATPDLHGNGVSKRLWAPHLSFELAEASDGPKDGTTSDGGWTRIVRTLGGARISLLADEPHLAEARRIAESAGIVEVDANGCEASSEIQAKGYLRPEPAFDVRRLDSVDSVAVCQYAHGAGTDKPWKLASRVISGDAAQNLLLEAIQDAPPGGGPDTPDTCAHDHIDGTAIVLRLREGDRVHDMYVYYESCIRNGFDDGTTRRALTLASCEPLWGGRVVHGSGSNAPFAACHSGLGGSSRK